MARKVVKRRAWAIQYASGGLFVSPDTHLPYVMQVRKEMWPLKDDSERYVRVLVTVELIDPKRRRVSK